MYLKYIILINKNYVWLISVRNSIEFNIMSIPYLTPKTKSDSIEINQKVTLDFLSNIKGQSRIYFISTLLHYLLLI